MKYKKLKMSIQDEKKMENLEADNAKLKDMLAYVAIMGGIELPQEEENVQRPEENA